MALTLRELGQMKREAIEAQNAAAATAVGPMPQDGGLGAIFDWINRYKAAGGQRTDSNNFLDDIGGFVGNIGNLALGTAGFGAGATTGASLATGNTDNLGQSLALDATGLLAASPLSSLTASLGGSGGVAAAGGGLGPGAEEFGISGVDFDLDLLGAGAGGAATAGGVLGSIPVIGDLLNALKDKLPSGDVTAALVPILAAISYARNQGPFDTSRLSSTYDEFSPDALAFEYDQNTSRGRNALTSSLSQRGVIGSSFGNMDLTNFQTSRDLGRRSLINQGLAQKGNIGATLLDAEIKERALKNQLYGQSLLAIGNVFGGKN